MREKHLRVLPRPEVHLRDRLLLAVHFEIDAQVRVRHVAVVPQIPADLQLLPHADHQLGVIERLDRDVVAHILAHVEKGDVAAATGILLQPVERLARARRLPPDRTRPAENR